MKRSILWKAAALIAIPATLALAGCAQQPAAPAADSSTPAAAPTSTFDGDASVPAAVDKPLKVGLVIRTTQGGWLEDYTKTITSEVAALGGSVQIYDAQNDLSKMASGVTDAINAGSDILLIDNGTQAALGTPLKAAVDKKIPVVAYDSDFTMPGVSAINQDDKALATNGMKAIDKDFDGKANIVVLSVAGYAPLDNRLAAVTAYTKAHPGIKIVAQTGTVSGNSSLDTAAQVEALLKSHPNKGQIDAIWTNWNDFSVGAAQALKAEQRTDVALYTVDLTDQNLPYFWDPAVDLRAVSASNPETIAISQVRLAYEKAAGEQVENLTVEPTLVTKAQLPKQQIAYSDLAKYVPSWSEDATVWPAWIKTLESRHK